ncbi:trans-1,2-dihydrobenzene-1,2-diol dehydrogenase isoform X1 [Hydra vulgaris]|uniref:trans-1,2-dihydrobenzene-1,2-diol dehydrogenase isoform X1 n=1 Tax=Hydra vulgaris TaxID=6087 RepID=UPI0001924132|nr:trans-1,2-dihydrobenzene-1,2-diol dehydrogenase-like [Hydra vulgaris]
MSQERPLRWGIFGCGKISFDFCIALSTLSKEKHTIAHVAARDISKAEEFAQHFNVKSFSGNYEDVAKDQDIDIIYVGTINPTHKSLSILAMSHGKPVLCEKPVCMDSTDLDEVLTCAKDNNVFFMEGMWTAFFPLYRELLSNIESGLYGDVNVVSLTFGIQNLFQKDRLCKPELGGSVLFDIGIYTLFVADMLFQGLPVKQLTACGHIDASTGIDRSESVTLLYEGNKTAQILIDGDHQLPNECVIFCSEGTVVIEAPFWCPSKFIFKRNDGNVDVRSFPLPDSEPTNFKHSVGLRFEAEHVRDCMYAGRLESGLVSHATSKRIMSLMQECKNQLKQ